MPNEEKLKVELFWSPVSNKEKFEGEVKSITSENKMGEFDVLPEHTNFITLIFNSLTLHPVDGTKETYKFNRGVLEVRSGQVKIFLEL